MMSKKTGFHKNKHRCRGGIAIKYFFDTEFIDDGHTIDLISIGIVSDDGREYYAQSVEYDEAKVSQWVKDNVLAHLQDCGNFPDDPRRYHETLQGFKYWDTHTDCPWRPREQIKTEILAFMDIQKYGKPELWGYYSAYDHVAFCQLFGPMMDLPRGFSKYTKDIKQFCDALGNPRLPEQVEGKHNALADARWNREAYTFLEGSFPYTVHRHG